MRHLLSILCVVKLIMGLSASTSLVSMGEVESSAPVSLPSTIVFAEALYSKIIDQSLLKVPEISVTSNNPAHIILYRGLHAKKSTSEADILHYLHQKPGSEPIRAAICRDPSITEVQIEDYSQRLQKLQTHWINPKYTIFDKIIELYVNDYKQFNNDLKSLAPNTLRKELEDVGLTHEESFLISTTLSAERAFLYASGLYTNLADLRLPKIQSNGEPENPIIGWVDLMVIPGTEYGNLKLYNVLDAFSQGRIDIRLPEDEAKRFSSVAVGSDYTTSEEVLVPYHLPSHLHAARVPFIVPSLTVLETLAETNAYIRSAVDRIKACSTKKEKNEAEKNLLRTLARYYGGIMADSFKGSYCFIRQQAQIITLSPPEDAKTRRNTIFRFVDHMGRKFYNPESNTISVSFSTSLSIELSVAIRILSADHFFKFEFHDGINESTVDKLLPFLASPKLLELSIQGKKRRPAINIGDRRKFVRVHGKYSPEEKHALDTLEGNFYSEGINKKHTILFDKIASVIKKRKNPLILWLTDQGLSRSIESLLRSSGALIRNKHKQQHASEIAQALIRTYPNLRLQLHHQALEVPDDYLKHTASHFGLLKEEIFDILCRMREYGYVGWYHVDDMKAFIKRRLKDLGASDSDSSSDSDDSCSFIPKIKAFTFSGSLLPSRPPVAKSGYGSAPMKAIMPKFGIHKGAVDFPNLFGLDRARWIDKVRATVDLSPYKNVNLAYEIMYGYYRKLLPDSIKPVGVLESELISWARKSETQEAFYNKVLKYAKYPWPVKEILGGALNMGVDLSKKKIWGIHNIIASFLNSHIEIYSYEAGGCFLAINSALTDNVESEKVIRIVDIGNGVYMPLEHL